MTKSFDPQSDFSLRGKTALVTGGGKGIGQGVAIGLARSGADIHIIDNTNTKPKSYVYDPNVFGGKTRKLRKQKV